MGEAPERDRASRAVMVLAVVLTLFGTCGVVRGIEVTTADPPPRIATGSPSATQASAVQHEVRWNAPLRRPLGAANVLVSLMLVGGAVLLVLRRANAVWWVTQAVLANVLWTLGEAASQITSLTQHHHRLARAFERMLEAQAGGGAPGWLRGPTGVWITIVVVVLVAVARVAAYLWIWRRIRRSDVREVVDVAAPDR